MSVTGARAAGARAVQKTMVDTCTITAPAAGEVYDPGTDSYVTPAGAVRYTGPCRVKPRDNADRVVDAAGQSVSLWPYVVSVPLLATEEVQLDDVVTITASADPAAVGLRLRVRDVPRGALLTARRLACEVQS